MKKKRKKGPDRSLYKQVQVKCHMRKPEKKIQNQQFMRKYAPEFIFSIGVN